MSAWGSVETTREYLVERHLDNERAFRASCAEAAVARMERRARMGESRQEAMDAWVERMELLARKRFGKTAQCLGTVSGRTKDWTIYTNSYKRELGPYSWAEMDEAMESWNERQQRPAQADAQEGGK